MRLHATELLMLLGTAILLLVERPVEPKTAEAAQQPPGELPLQQPQLLHNH